MIVRLKVYPRCPHPVHEDMFQFYDSPIKRSVATAHFVIDSLFQFYDSPIKSRRGKTRFRGIDNVSIL